ncbi:hypothetical protein GOBAR_AA08783 [Gossypium barbadense]|uniref:Uncharacterized protein n=1 Tax=Gossypium barbadense TaxID=3634 RepID=A0A2P5Y8D0_GOSBA|nr:hypothetical protein GOBAR_AA08783 [Gossypium barbadense]
MASKSKLWVNCIPRPRKAQLARSPHLIPLLQIYHQTITYYYIISLNNMPQKKLHTLTKIDVDGVKFKTGEKEKDKTGPGAIQTNNKHGDSVSWKVPHRKHGEKLSGFINLDYSPPKTHPPSHN